MPAVVRIREFGAHALPAGAGLEDDVMAIDQVFAAPDGFGSRRDRSVRRGSIHGFDSALQSKAFDCTLLRPYVARMLACMRRVLLRERAVGTLPRLCKAKLAGATTAMKLGKREHLTKAHSAA